MDRIVTLDSRDGDVMKALKEVIVLRPPSGAA